MWYVVVVAVVWVAFGAAVGFREARRGHWRGLVVLGALAGPFALPLARQAEQDERSARVQVIDEGRTRNEHGLRLLAGVDGSDDALDAVRTAAELLGFRVGSLTLATVAEFEVDAPRGDLSPEEPADAAYRAVLAEASEKLGGWLGFDPGTVLLVGRPADALVDHAREEGFDALVVSNRGEGLAKQLFGSCASRLAEQTTVPVMVIPRPR